MRLVVFCHSLLSDFAHRSAHFLRGVVADLLRRGHDVRVWEARDAWSVENLVRAHGDDALTLALSAYPTIRPRRYDRATLDLDAALDGADVVIVHDWNEGGLVGRIGDRRKKGARCKLLFHDSHHRATRMPAAISDHDLSGYDGVLACGEALRETYERHGWSSRAWVWHEAADPRVFRPLHDIEPIGDVVSIGNWAGRAAEIGDLLAAPARALSLRARVHGVGYPNDVIAMLIESGVRFGGWLPNFRVPDAFARHRVAIDLPRRARAEALPGTPTIGLFEALACGIPLVSGVWDDREGLFEAGHDYLLARNAGEMRAHLRMLLADPPARRAIVDHGLATIHARHTCAHRVDELFAITRSLGIRPDEQWAPRHSVA